MSSNELSNQATAQVEVQTTTVCGIHGIHRLERHDEAGRFNSDGDAQVFARKAIEMHDELASIVVDAWNRWSEEDQKSNPGLGARLELASQKIVEDMDVVITPIGQLDHGSEGRDEFVLLTRKDDDLTPKQAIDWLLPRVYRDTNRPGGYFCHTVRAVNQQHSANKVICTVEHRYDV